MSLPILYSFRRCPYAIRARMAMAKAGISWEHREVSLKNMPDEMLSVSAKGTVPVLVLTDGRVIDESLDVMLWSLDRNDPGLWLDTDMGLTLELICLNDYDFKPCLDRYKYHVRYQELSQEQHREQGCIYLSRLNDQLERNNGKGLVCSSTSLADVAIFPFIRQFAGVDREWFDNSSYRYLVNWLSDWENSQEFRQIMQKYDYWTNSAN